MPCGVEYPFSGEMRYDNHDNTLIDELGMKFTPVTRQQIVNVKEGKCPHCMEKPICHYWETHISLVDCPFVCKEI